MLLAQGNGLEGHRISSRSSEEVGTTNYSNVSILLSYRAYHAPQLTSSICSAEHVFDCPRPHLHCPIRHRTAGHKVFPPRALRGGFQDGIQRVAPSGNHQRLLRVGFAPCTAAGSEQVLRISKATEERLQSTGSRLHWIWLKRHAW